jgi:hypothetical protein
MRYYPGICLKGLRKTTKTSVWIASFQSQDLNLGPHEYKAGVLITRPRYSVCTFPKLLKKLNVVAEVSCIIKESISHSILLSNISGQTCHNLTIKIITTGTVVTLFEARITLISNAGATLSRLGLALVGQYCRGQQE